MPSPYSYELRVRVMNALEYKMPVAEVIRIFSICKDTVYKWKALKESTGDTKAKTGYQSGYTRMVIKDLDGFKAFIDKHPDKNLRELASFYPYKVSQSTIANYISRIGYTYKKKPSTIPQEILSIDLNS